jgi:heavy metal sensor kinase
MIKAPASIRARLTLWYALIMALVLAVFAFATFAYVRESLFAQIDARLDENLSLIITAARTSLSDLAEVEHDTRVLNFRVVEDEWPLYVSGGWSAANLDIAGAPPDKGRWIYAPALGGIYHLKEKIVVVGTRRLRVSAAEQSEQIHRGLDRLSLTLIGAFPLTLLLSLFGGYFLVGRMLTPLQHITQRARSISAENLDERLAVANPRDELGQLSTLLNDAFARLDESFNRLRCFTQDAAHELRTPLAVLRSVGEVGLQEPRDPFAYREIIGSMLEEVDRLARLVDGLLMLARAESGRFSVAKRPEDLRALGQEVVECLLVLAEEKNQRLSFDAEKSLSADIDRDTLRIALINVIANAIRFTPKGGTISVVLRTDGSGSAIDVEDNGPGIALEHQAHIFERFYRVDTSRSHLTGGTGLGLAIARWAVEANSGTIGLQSVAGQGCLFRILLPASNGE